MNQSKSYRTRIFGFLQELGKSFMFPVSTLSAMGILVGIGSAFTSGPVLEAIPILNNEYIQIFFNFINTIGSIGFSYLPVLFAMSIPFGLSNRNKGGGAIAAFAGFVAMHLAINFVLGLQGNLAAPDQMRVAGQGMALGIQSFEMGVLGGVVVGLIVYYLNEKYQDIVLPDAFSFFGGIRFVPIISILVMSIAGIVLIFIWPFFQDAIANVGTLINSIGIFGPFLYGFANALLKPFGMHHIFLALVRFTDAGGSQVIDGEVVSGALNIFYAQLNTGEPISPQATAFLSQGFMPIFMFALPAITLAIYHTAKKDKRASIKGMLISAVFVSVVTGISEPTEFLFLFVAPVLYLFHAVMQGLSLMIMSILGVTIGNTDGGIIDFVLFGIMQGSYTRWILVIPVGLLFFGIYYYVFKKYILVKNVETPGREIETGIEESGREERINPTSKNEVYNPEAILQALGGSNNINTLDNCVTRLRLNVKDSELIDEKTLKKNGALAVMKLDDHNVQVVIGAQVQSVKTGIENLMLE